VAIVYNLPRFFERTTVHGNDTSATTVNVQTSTMDLSPGDHVTPSISAADRTSDLSSALHFDHPRVARTALHEDPIYIVVYRTGLFFLARFLLPFSALAFFNTRLIMAVRDSTRLPGRHRGSSVGAPRSPTYSAAGGGGGGADGGRRAPSRLQRQNTTSSSPNGRKERYTLTLVVVVIVFVVCELPDMLLRTWLALHSCLPWMPFPREELQFVNGASNLCLTLNSSVNFLVYCFVGQRFRVVLVRMMCPARLRFSPRPSASSPLLASDGCVVRVGAFRAGGGSAAGGRGGRPAGLIVDNEHVSKTSSFVRGEVTNGRRYRQTARVSNDCSVCRPNEDAFD
jgi:uncharacterized membrane protein YgcG